MNKTANQYKKGDLITTVNGVSFYYLCKDGIMKYKDEPCHFLTSNLNSKKSGFRVTAQVEEWEDSCKGIYNKLYKRFSIK